MRRIGRGLAALTLASAGVAMALVGASGPASAGGSLVDIEVGDVIIHDAVDVSWAANLCNIQVATINSLDKGEKTECTALSTPLTKAWVVKR